MILRYAMPVPWESDGAAPLLHMARVLTTNEEYKRGTKGATGKRGLIIISSRVPEHPRFTAWRTYARTYHLEVMSVRDFVLRIEHGGGVPWRRL